MSQDPPGRFERRWAAANARAARADLFGFLRRLHAQHGDVSRFTLWGTAVIFVHELTAVRELLMAREPLLRKPGYVKASNRGHWGDGLTTLEGDAWAARRPLLQPSFTAAHVQRRLAVVAECTEAMLARWPHEGDIDLGAELRGLTARIALRTVLDADIEGLGDPAARSGLVPLAEAWGEDFTARDARGLAMVRPRAPARMDAVRRLVAERLKGGERRGDVLSELVHARDAQGHALTHEALEGEVIQMLYAGHLTLPASLLPCWAAVYQYGLRERVAASPEAALPVLKESLRLHAPAPLLYREVAEAFEWQGWRFPAGHAVWVSPQLLQTDERYHREPERFDAARFDGRAGAPPAGAFMPFGLGPRTCIAHHLALQQMALILHRVSRQFALRPQGHRGAGFHARRCPGLGAECHAAAPG